MLDSTNRTTLLKVVTKQKTNLYLKGSPRIIHVKEIKSLLKQEELKPLTPLFQLFFELFCFEAPPLYVLEVHNKHSEGLQ